MNLPPGTATALHLHKSPGGIPKHPINPAAITRTGIVGDSWAHPRYHGGPDQALLLIASEVIAELAAAGYLVFPGALGENVTTRNLSHSGMRSGQRYLIGEVVIELTKLRVPCRTLDVYGPGIQAELYDNQCKRGDPRSPKWARGGFYARVLQGGEVREGDIIRLLDQAV